MSRTTPSWLLLVMSLPTQSATGRMRIWRALKALGCAALRDGAYLLPAGSQHQTSLQELADECVREGGSAWVMSAGPASVDDGGSSDMAAALYHQSGGPQAPRRLRATGRGVRDVRAASDVPRNPHVKKPTPPASSLLKYPGGAGWCAIGSRTNRRGAGPRLSAVNPAVTYSPRPAPSADSAAASGHPRSCGATG